MARSTNTRVAKRHIILCEGRDAEEFMINFLNSVKSDRADFLHHEIQVFDFGGNENLYNFIEILKKMDGYDRVRSMLVIRDAEASSERAQNDIQAALTRAKLPTPRSVYAWESGDINTAFLLFPTCDRASASGTLEDLCLSILAEDGKAEILNDIDDFIMSLKQNRERRFPHEFKAKLHTYFSVTDRYVSLKIGEAARAGAFDWENEALDALRRFVESMGEGE